MSTPPSKKLKLSSMTELPESPDMFAEEEEEDQQCGGLERLGPGSELPAQFAAPQPSPHHTVAIDDGGDL